MSNTPLPGPVMVDVAGLTLTEHESERLRHPLTGAVILFARNFESRAQLKALCDDIHATRSPRLLIAVDHEGGRVQRFRTDGFTHLPTMRALGELWQRDAMSATRAATACGYVLAAELRACGVDFSFTPVLDLDYGRSAVIGTRAFHWDARVTAVLAKSLIHGLLQAGMKSCGKHFPGHGYVEADSHHEIPVDERSLDEVLAGDAMPYEWLAETLASVMPAHVIFPKVDPQPAGFSRFWLQDVLRKRFRFEGAIFSDDLAMEGATVAGDIHARARAALNAGCDMIPICNRPDLADELLAANALQFDPVRARRIQALHAVGDPADWQSLQADPLYRAARSVIEPLLGQ
ncbi:beta-N-acetylhexosaminidase [Piscinibacterium candidicorallinum]|uniref:Beta-hexosaminidase n=1 Tax=Piscinibacterium candidicorallinum TaxID=1793872 RepID=A0ABV7H6S9_9BURK